MSRPWNHFYFYERDHSFRDLRGVPFLPYIYLLTIHPSTYLSTALSRYRRIPQTKQIPFFVRSTCSTKYFVPPGNKLWSTGSGDVRGQIHPQTPP
ncbi:uncharacterized protein BO96DRAFT_89396 [Aspergillus niger CBS 101883]|uniref:uncharacterized protein n=1 Tax=Aspergillus lacticoffeatus (strain CBS 101883) TaxID=1450533 RepID=UPI000D802ACE|nr:uncharacterized protein BO96DRAFT_89396 [Aspergillus niger CBS 101883]PYH61052.1 hypothetical protein BO96DRAFT_89396 [Aspergillus niger CBS 101883]